MKPPPFDYHGPASLGETLQVLAEVGPHGKVLAGGQSLIPLLNMRLAAPAHLVDINRVAELDTIAAGPGGVRVGALARHAAVERSAAARAVQPLLGQALRLVAHPVIRNRGTVVGSLVHADPSAELPAVLALLGGSVRLARLGGEREVGAAEFFTGPLESDLAPGELAVSAFFPALPERSGTAFCEVARRHGDYAMAGVAAAVTLDEDFRIAAARVACVSVGPVPVVVDVTEVCGPRPAASADWDAVARAVQDRIDPEEDIHATATYRRHLTGVLVTRALRSAADEAGQGAL
ncbi:xanthine dehydrogenase family protein subunit M [Planotetraspora sp. GP83]|uniref:FAD binding domain-containing protein n=1 Tax=Planotetraspora sp. GP83 TaxID=3156264 RepID=UPI003515DC95